MNLLVLMLVTYFPRRVCSKQLANSVDFAEFPTGREIDLSQQQKILFVLCQFKDSIMNLGETKETVLSIFVLVF
jgi:hypothetical protein